MGFGKGNFATIWRTEDKGRYTVAEMSTSKKNKETDQYETDWNNKFVRLVGTAHDQAKNFKERERVKIGSCDVTNKYDKEKNTTYTNYVIFGFEDVNGSNSKSNNKQSSSSVDKGGFMNIPDGVDEELPFN